MCLRGHTGLVKGLTWDPVGKYIASQADDHSLKVWRTVDWQMEANITKPFSEVQNRCQLCDDAVETSGLVMFFSLFIYRSHLFLHLPVLSQALFTNKGFIHFLSSLPAS